MRRTAPPRVQIDRPVFIIGVDHSGTTILYRMMSRHPELAWLSRYSLRGGELKGRWRIPGHGLINRLGRRLPQPWEKDRAGWLPRPLEGAGIWRQLLPRDDRFRDAGDYTEELGERLRDVLGAELRSWKLSRLLIKIPYITRSTLLLDRVFPDARFVHIVRDGRAVALSNRSRFAKRTGSEWEGLRAAAGNWRDTLAYLDGARRFLGSRLMLVTYEDLCADVHQWVRAIFAFADLDPDQASLRGIPERLEPTNGKWLERCSPDERLMLESLLGETLERYGYGAATPAAPDERVPALAADA